MASIRVPAAAPESRSADRDGPAVQLAIQELSADTLTQESDQLRPVHRQSSGSRPG